MFCIISEGKILFSRTSDVDEPMRRHFLKDPEESSNDEGEKSPLLSESDSITSVASPTTIPTPPDITPLLQKLRQQQSGVSSPPPLPPPPPLLPQTFTFSQQKIPPITSQSFVLNTAGSSGLSNSLISPALSSKGTATSDSHKIANRSIKKAKPNKPSTKSKVIKFHEYRGPPNVVKNQQSSSSSPVPTDPAAENTSYSILLQQQQLLLQWQLEMQQQQKNVSFLMPGQKSSASSSQDSFSPQPSPGNSSVMSPQSVGHATPQPSLLSPIPTPSPATTPSPKPPAIVASPLSVLPPPPPPLPQVALAPPQTFKAFIPNSVTTSSKSVPPVATGGTLTFTTAVVSSAASKTFTAKPAVTATATTTGASSSITNISTLTPAKGMPGEKRIGSASNVRTTPVTKLEDLKVAELKAECKKRSLLVSGPKPNLLERLKPFSEAILASLAAQASSGKSCHASVPSVISDSSLTSPPSVASLGSSINIAPLTPLNDDAMSMTLGSPPMSPSSGMEQGNNGMNPPSSQPMSPVAMMDINTPGFSLLTQKAQKSKLSASQPIVPMSVDQSMSRPPSAVPMDIDLGGSQGNGVGAGKAFKDSNHNTASTVSGGVRSITQTPTSSIILTPVTTPTPGTPRSIPGTPGKVTVPSPGSAGVTQLKTLSQVAGPVPPPAPPLPPPGKVQATQIIAVRQPAGVGGGQGSSGGGGTQISANVRAQLIHHFSQLQRQQQATNLPQQVLVATSKPVIQPTHIQVQGTSIQPSMLRLAAPTVTSATATSQTLVEVTPSQSPSILAPIQVSMVKPASIKVTTPTPSAQPVGQPQVVTQQELLQQQQKQIEELRQQLAQSQMQLAAAHNAQQEALKHAAVGTSSTGAIPAVPNGGQIAASLPPMPHPLPDNPTPAQIQTQIQALAAAVQQQNALLASHANTDSKSNTKPITSTTGSKPPLMAQIQIQHLPTPVPQVLSQSQPGIVPATTVVTTRAGDLKLPTILTSHPQLASGLGQTGQPRLVFTAVGANGQQLLFTSQPPAGSSSTSTTTTTVTTSTVPSTTSVMAAPPPARPAKSNNSIPSVNGLGSK